MSLESFAQELIVVDPSSMEPHMEGGSFIPLEVSDMSPYAGLYPEPEDRKAHEHQHDRAHDLENGSENMEVSEPADIEIFIEDLPGAPPGTHDPEPVLEVSEDDKKEESKDENEAQSKKPEKWDWASKGPDGFVVWIKARIDDVPKHSGQDSAGLERAISYMERLDNEISRAMRLDLDGELDANKVEAVRSQIDDGISRLHDRLDKVKKHSKSRRKKKADFSETLVKEAQKITGVQGTFVVVSLLISRLGRIIINGMVSAGHNPEDMFKKLSEKYKLNDREQAELMQFLSDAGFTLRQDRGYMLDEDVDYASSDNFDWSANYKG